MLTFSRQILAFLGLIITMKCDRGFIENEICSINFMKIYYVCTIRNISEMLRINVFCIMYTLTQHMHTVNIR